MPGVAAVVCDATGNTENTVRRGSCGGCLALGEGTVFRSGR